MEIKVGDKVAVEHGYFRNLCGTVTATFGNEMLSTKVYEVQFDDTDSKFIIPEEDLRLMEAETETGNYELKIDVAHNIVVAMLLKNGGEIARGHGHIIHSGDIGIAQAISYAAKRIWWELGGSYDDK